MSCPWKHGGSFRLEGHCWQKEQIYKQKGWMNSQYPSKWGKAMPEVFLCELTSFSSSTTAIRKILLFANRGWLTESGLFFLVTTLLSESCQDSTRPATALGIPSMPGGNAKRQSSYKVFFLEFLTFLSRVKCTQAGCLHMSVDPQPMHMYDTHSSVRWHGKDAAGGTAAQVLPALCGVWACLGSALNWLALW